MQTQVNACSQAEASSVDHVRSIGRAVLGTAVAACCCTVVASFLWGVLGSRAASVGAPGPTTTTDLLTLLLAGSALVLLLWLALVTMVAALCVVPGAVGRVAQRLAARLTPLFAARVLSLVLGSAIVGAVPGSAAAGTGTPRPQGGAVATAPDPGFAPLAPSQRRATPAGPSATVPLATTPAPRALGGLSAPDPRFVPTRPRVRPVLAPGALAQGGIPAPQGIVVHRGDTLWAIAARRLGPDATDAEVAAQWPRWHAANRAVIGPDPDVILPGQVLVPPATEAAR